MTSTQVTQISLEALLLRATNPNNSNIDSAAVEAFCALINKEKDGPHIGVKVIAARLPVGNEKEVLSALNILDTCMTKCGTQFQNEVGKFRFLNEMIKLVSPKYLGSKTPLTVKLRVLELLYLWTLDYPKEVKIKEAFEMLRKQGVVKEIPNPNVPHEALICEKKRNASSVFHDEEKSNILRKLLQSKDPEDIQAANWLIKSMVKEDEKISDFKSKAVSELESVQNNLKLLNEMMESYKKGVTTNSELDLMKELYDNCVRLRPNLTAIACQNNQCPPDLLESILRTSDEVTEALSRYHRTILLNEGSNSSQSNLASLLELDQECFHKTSLIHLEGKQLEGSFKENSCSSSSVTSQDSTKTVDVLCDLLAGSGDAPVESLDILKPVSVTNYNNTSHKEPNRRNKSNGLEDLDVLGELLLKENIQSSNYRSHEKLPMNLLGKSQENLQNQSSNPGKNECLKLDLNSFITKENEKLLHHHDTPIDTTDDCLVDITEDDSKLSENDSSCKIKESSEPNQETLSIKSKCDTSIKLNDIFVKLEDIKPSSKKSIIALEEKNGINVLLHLAKDMPKPGVSVYVITTVSKNEMPLGGYVFQAIVPKGCKLKLQPPSSTDLPAFNPFLPPAAITQIMLIFNPEGAALHLKFVISYVMDEETVTEMGEIDDLPTCDGI